MGRMKDVLGALLRDKSERDFLGEWMEIPSGKFAIDPRTGEKKPVRSGKYRSRWTVVIGTSWRDQSYGDWVRVFVHLSNEYYDNNYDMRKSAGMRNMHAKHSGAIIWERVSKITQSCKRYRVVLENNVLVFYFNRRETNSAGEIGADSFGDFIRKNFDPDAVTYVENRKSNMSDQIYIGPETSGQIVSFKDENVTGKYFHVNGKDVHIFYYHRGRRRDDGFYEGREEWWNMFTIENFGSPDEVMTEPEILHDIHDAPEVDRLIREAFPIDNQILRAHRARERAKEQILKGHFIDPRRTNITAKFDADSLTPVEKAKQAGADELGLKFIIEDAAKRGEILTREEALKLHPAFREFLKEKAAPVTTRKKTSSASPNIVIVRPHIAAESRKTPEWRKGNAD